jgi:hypothetical protein
MLFPEVKRKQRKAPYKKPEAVKLLEQMATDEVCCKHPNLPQTALSPRKYRDDTTNGLTACITTYLKLKGAFVSRLNNGGVYDQRLNRYRPGTNRKGLPDVVCTYKGKSLMIEVKTARDRLSEHQEKIRQEQERSGGLYFVAHDFTSFKTCFDTIQ